MKIEFDPAKDETNLLEHGLSFNDFEGFDDEPLELIDNRADYGEVRFRSFGRIDGVGYMIVYTIRNGAMRLISFRRAHEKEMRRYE